MFSQKKRSRVRSQIHDKISRISGFVFSSRFVWVPKAWEKFQQLSHNTTNSNLTRVKLRVSWDQENVLSLSASGQRAKKIKSFYSHSDSGMSREKISSRACTYEHTIPFSRREVNIQRRLNVLASKSFKAFMFLRTLSSPYIVFLCQRLLSPVWIYSPKWKYYAARALITWHAHLFIIFARRVTEIM